MKILLVESLARARALASIFHDDISDIAATREDASAFLASYRYDVVLLGVDFAGLLAVVRQKGDPTPVIVIATHRDDLEEVGLLDSGADDYLLWSASPRVITARARAVVRRLRGYPASKVQVGPVSIDLATRAVAVAGTPVHLTGREYRTLEFLALRKGAMRTRNHIMDHICADAGERCVKNVDTLICRLRKKFRMLSPTAAALFVSVRGHGYKMVESSPA